MDHDWRSNFKTFELLADCTVVVYFYKKIKHRIKTNVFTTTNSKIPFQIVDWRNLQRKYSLTISFPFHIHVEKLQKFEYARQECYKLRILKPQIEHIHVPNTKTVEKIAPVRCPV